jgi:hypothetical protein
LKRNEKRKLGGTNGRLPVLNTLLSDDKMARMKSYDWDWLGTKQDYHAKGEEEDERHAKDVKAMIADTVSLT